MPWTPSLPATDEPLYARLAQALQHAIAEGELPPGERLPTHRDLAFRLGLSVGTATKAYAEAERRGLIVSHVGRGSFVSGERRGTAPPATPARIDLSRNLPPLRHAGRYLADGLVKIASEAGAQPFLDYAPVEGAERHRRAIARWIECSSSFEGVDWQRLVLCNGAQHAMQLAFSVLCKRGDKVLVEAATFPGMKAIASLAGLRLHGVALDAEGLEPGALDRAARETGARILYAMPSLQNPTARSMSEGRRRSIVDLAREHDLIIVEDDVYAPYARKAGIPPLASLAPERCFHLGSASKAIAPGLRAGWLLPPGGDAWRMPILMRLRASSLALPGFGHALLTRWIEDGTVERILDGVRAEIATRIDVARRILGGRIEWPAITETPHLWAPLPPVEAERCVARAIELGIALTPPAAVLVDAGAISGLRICLGGAPDIATLERALRALSDALGSALTPLEQTAL